MSHDETSSLLVFIYPVFARRTKGTTKQSKRTDCFDPARRGLAMTEAFHIDVRLFFCFDGMCSFHHEEAKS